MEKYEKIINNFRNWKNIKKDEITFIRLTGITNVTY